MFKTPPRAPKSRRFLHESRKLAAPQISLISNRCANWLAQPKRDGCTLVWAGPATVASVQVSERGPKRLGQPERQTGPSWTLWGPRWSFLRLQNFILLSLASPGGPADTYRAPVSMRRASLGQQVGPRAAGQSGPATVSGAL